MSSSLNFWSKNMPRNWKIWAKPANQAPFWLVFLMELRIPCIPLQNLSAARLTTLKALTMASCLTDSITLAISAEWEEADLNCFKMNISWRSSLPTRVPANTNSISNFCLLRKSMSRLSSSIMSSKRLKTSFLLQPYRTQHLMPASK